MTDLTIDDLAHAATGTQVQDRDGSVWVKDAHHRNGWCDHWVWANPDGLRIYTTSRGLVFELAPITEVTSNG